MTTVQALKSLMKTFASAQDAAGEAEMENMVTEA